MTTVVEALDAIAASDVQDLGTETGVISWATLHHGNGS